IKSAVVMHAGGRLRVVVHEATHQVRPWAQSKSMELHQRSLQPDDLTGMFLVVATTSSAELHQRIFEEATRRCVHCNIVDVPVLCDFYYPAVVQRGALQIAISTAGKSPALAQRLRKQLEEQFGAEFEEWLAQLGEVRDRLQSSKLDPEERKRLLHEDASEEAFEAFRRKRRQSKCSG